MNERRLGLLVACLFLPLASQGQEAPAVRLSNALRINYASSDKLLGDQRHLGLATFESKALIDIAPAVTAALQVRASGGRHGGAAFPFAYLDLKTSAIDLRIGKQILAWGRTDALNPTDIVTPRDYTTLLPFDEDERRGTWGVRTNVYATESVLASLFYGVKFKPSTLPLASDATQSFAFDTAGARQQQLGLRLSSSGDVLDASVSAYRGASLLPQAERIETLPGQVTLTRMRYPLVTMLGFDLAGNLGRVALRVEGASVRPEQPEAPGRHGMRPYRYLVAGADRSFFSDLNITLQVFGRWADEGPADAAPGEEQRIEMLNNLIFVQTRKNTYGMTARVANQWWNQTLSAELFVQHYFGDGSSYVHPMVSYALTDQLKVSAGAQYYRGRAQTLFGTMKNNNAVFTELRYSF